MQTAYEHLQNVIEAHYRYLLGHKLYLTRIANNEIGVEDIVDYLKDIFNLRINPEHFKKNNLATLQITLHDRLNVFKELIRIVKNGNEQAILTLALILEYEIQCSKIYSLAHSISVQLKSKVLFAFHEIDFLRVLQAELKQILPANYSRLLKTIKFKEQLKQERHVSASGIIETRKVSISIDTCWEPLLQEILDKQPLIIPKISNPKMTRDKSFSSKSSAHSECFEVVGLVQRIEKIKKEKIKSRAEQTDLQLMENHVDVFLAVEPYYQQLFYVVTNWNKKINHDNNIEKYQAFIKTSTNKLNKINSYLNRAYETFLRSVSTSVFGAKNDRVKKEDFGSLKEKIGIITKVLNVPRNHLPNGINNLEVFVSENERLIQEVFVECKRLHHSMINYSSETQPSQLENLKAEQCHLLETKIEIECITTEHKTLFEESRKIFIQEQKVKLDAFRAEVNKKKEEKIVTKEKTSPRK